MLEKLFGSVSRVKLLKIFLLNPDKKYYIRQLARDLKLQVNSVRRELGNLEEFGLLLSDGNNSINLPMVSNGRKAPSAVKEKAPSLKEKKYYQVNKNFVLFTEIKSLIIKSQILAGESFIISLKKFCDPKFIMLSGMFVNNTNSPTDVLIVANIKKEDLLQIINDLEREMGREINFTLMDEEEFKYRQEIADVFLHSLLNSRRMILLDKILDIENTKK